MACNSGASGGVFSVAVTMVVAACERGEETMNQQNNNPNQNPSQQQREQQQREQQQREQQQREKSGQKGQGQNPDQNANKNKDANK